jgi:hypothetical protein
MSRSSWASASRASAEAASEAAGRADRAGERQAARSKLTERPLSNFVKPVPRLRLNGWRIWNDQRADPAGRSGGAGQGGRAPSGGQRAGSMQGACGGRLSGPASSAARLPPGVARLNTADAAWAVAGWVGPRLHKSKCSPSLKFVRTARPFESCAKKSPTHKNLVRNVRYESGFGGLRPPVRSAEKSNSTYRHGTRIIRVFGFWPNQYVTNTCFAVCCSLLFCCVCEGWLCTPRHGGPKKAKLQGPEHVNGAGAAEMGLGAAVTGGYLAVTRRVFFRTGPRDLPERAKRRSAAPLEHLRPTPLRGGPSSKGREDSQVIFALERICHVLATYWPMRRQ